MRGGSGKLEIRGNRAHALRVRPLWIFPALLGVLVAGAAWTHAQVPTRHTACCECLHANACTDVAVDTCELILDTPRDQSGGAPWRYQSLLGGVDDATECASTAIFTDFDAPRAGCGAVCTEFAF